MYSPNVDVKLFSVVLLDRYCISYVFVCFVCILLLFFYEDSKSRGTSALSFHTAISIPVT